MGSRNHIFHLDLKPANILLDRNNIPKIGDFGISRLGSTQTYVTQKMRGTFGYMPPEYIDKQEIMSKFDVFSLGVIILQIIAGRTHSSQRSDMPSGQFIRIALEHWTKWMQTESSSDASWEVKICIEIALRCVESDRRKRPTIAEIVDKLNKVDTSKSSSTCKIVDLRSEKDSDEQCASSDNCGVTTPVPNEAEELPREHTTGTALNKLSQQLVPRQITIWLSLAVVLAAVIVLVLRFDLGPEVQAVSLRTLICLHRIYLWLIRLAIWLSIVLLGAIVILVLCFIIVPLVKDISLRTLITRPRHIRLAIWLCVAVVLAAITVLVIRFDVVPEVKAISLGTLTFLLRILVWIIRWAFWLGVAMLLATTIACVVAKHTLCDRIFFFLLIMFLATWVTVAVMLAAISVPVLRLVVVPELKADIEDARINSFALFTSGMDSFFEYNISVAISIRNPIQAMSVTYTEPLASTVLFNEQRLYNDTLISVGQKHPAGKVRVYLLYSIGQVPSHVLGADAVDEYVKQNATGVFNMEVRMSGEITLGLGERHKLSLSCPLSLRLTPGVIEFRTMYCVPVETGKKYF